MTIKPVGPPLADARVAAKAMPSASLAQAVLDTNILIYCFDSASKFHAFAQQSVVESAASGQGAINPVILSELAVGDDQPETLASRVLLWGIHILDLPQAK